MSLKKSLQETKLWKHLETRDRNLAEVAIRMAETAEPQLAKIVEVFPLYTRHDAEHSLNIIRRIEDVVSKKAFGKTTGFSASESLILIAAAFYHDIGMSIFKWEKESDFLLHDKETNIQTLLRNTHADRGLKFLQHEYESMGLPKNLITPIHNVMRAHNMSRDQILADPSLLAPAAAEMRELEILDLVATFCIADALEFSDERVISPAMKLRRDLEELQNEDEKVSYLENQKHVCIGSSVAIKQNGIVIFSGTFDQVEVLGLAHRTIDDLEDWTRQYIDLCRDFERTRLRTLIFPFSRQLSMPGVSFERLGIRIRADSIIQLISSNSTWTDSPAAPIRELLQNAVEACRYRTHITPVSANYSGHVTVRMNRSTRILSVSDNGCGMTRETILDHFLNVGHSRSENASYRAHDFKSIARFGIGFWSVFTIAEIASVETCTSERPWNEKLGICFDVSTNRILDYTVLKARELQPGTTVTLTIKADVDVDRFEAAMKSIVISSEIPISIEMDSALIEVPSSPSPKSFEEFYDLKIVKSSELGAKVFQKEFDEGELSSAITIGYGKVGGKATFKFSGFESIVNLKGNMQSCALGVCGFPNNIQISPILFDFKRVGALNANVTDPSGFQFALNRRSLIENNRVESVRWMLQTHIHSAFSSLIEAHCEASPPEVYRLNEESSCHGGNPAASFNAKGFPWLEENFPELIAAKYFAPSEPKLLPNYKWLSDLRECYSDLFFLENSSIFRCQFVAERDFSKFFQLFRETVNRLYPAANVCLAPCDSVTQNLFDHTSNASVVLPFPPEMGLAMMRVPLKKKSFTGSKGTRIENIRGRWSGTVFFRDILSLQNDQFVFLGQHRLIVNPRSPLASEFRDLNSENRLTVIAEIAHKLRVSRDGSLVAEVERFL